MNRLQPASQLKLAVPLPRREGFSGPFRQHRRMIKCPQVGDSGRKREVAPRMSAIGRKRTFNPASRIAIWLTPDTCFSYIPNMR